MRSPSPYGQCTACGSARAESWESTAAELTSGGLFSAEEASTYRWRITLNEEQVRRLFTTFSDWSADEVDSAARAVRDLGGHVDEHYQSWLIVLRPVSHADA